MSSDIDAVVAEGTWMFGGEVPSAIRIARRDTWYGSGDEKDPDDIANDHKLETYVLEFIPVGDARFAAEGGQYASLDEATAAAEGLCGGSVRWAKRPKVE